MTAEPPRAATAWVQIPSDGLRTRHYRGFPPKLAGGVDARQFMAPAVLVLARPAGEDGWHLDRYATDGSFAGNTWHAAWVDADYQLRFEYVSDFVFEPVP